MLPQTLSVLEDGRGAGLHPGAQLYVSLRGRTVADLALGESRPGVPMRADTVMLWMSSVKPVLAVAIGQLWERGKLGLDDPVARHLPEFAAHGKEAVTVRHVLTHTGGFRQVAARWQSAPWDELVAKVCAAPREPNWEPGRRAGYHVASGWVVLGELVRRLDGRVADVYVRQQIYEPLGMSDSWLTLRAEEYQRLGDRLGVMYDTSRRLAIATGLDTAEAAALLRPGGNGRGPIRELGRFYEMLRRGGEQVLRPETVAEFTRRQRVGLRDETFNATIDWGLGFILESSSGGGGRMPYGYGQHATRETYGHSGNQSSAAFCDPVHALVVAWVCNGMCGEPAHQRRADEINTAIYQDLGLQRLAR